MSNTKDMNSLQSVLAGNEITGALEKVKLMYGISSNELHPVHQLKVNLEQILKQVVEPIIDYTNSFLEERFGSGYLKLILLENFTKRNVEIAKYQRLFMQVFITSAEREFNPLTDPYYIIEGDSIKLSISMNGVDENNHINTDKMEISSDKAINAKQMEDLKDKFIKDFETFLSYTLNTLVV